MSGLCDDARCRGPRFAGDKAPSPANCGPLQRASSQSPLNYISAYGENCVRSLAPPFPNEPASLGFVWVPFPPKAYSSHVCGPRSIFRHAHVAAENGLYFILPHSGKTLRGFWQTESGAKAPLFCVFCGFIGMRPAVPSSWPPPLAFCRPARGSIPSARRRTGR